MIKLDITKKLLTAQGVMELRINETFEQRDFVALYGKSGAGKTTTLRILAGLTKPDSGLIRVNDETWFDSKNGVNLPPQHRAIGFVFQDYALFPNMTVRQNLAYALPRGEKSDIVTELLTMVDLHQLAERKPQTLSGGQRQRIALARALVRRPKILLLDEPLSALDVEMRRKLQNEVLALHKRFEMTTLLVSHDLGEIFKLCQRVLVIDAGKIIKTGHPSEVFIGKKLSGKFKFEGEILAIQQNDVVFIITIAIGNTPVKVIATAEEIADLSVGDRVIVASKAFNPVILPVKKKNRF